MAFDLYAICQPGRNDTAVSWVTLLETSLIDDSTGSDPSYLQLLLICLLIVNKLVDCAIVEDVLKYMKKLKVVCTFYKI